MAGVRAVVRRVADSLTGVGLDSSLVDDAYVDLGAHADRARAVANRLNAVRDGPPKQAVVLWTRSYVAITRRGRWIYVARSFAERLTDAELAFVLGHEMAHHDLGHLSLMYAAAGWLGNAQQIELAADRLGLELAVRAGFDRRAALQALDPQWDDPPVEPSPSLPPALDRYLDRFRRTHPSMRERRAALERPR
ncbi:MAG: M48 family metalloprotease [Myxococcota bacterium]